jgi:hypothetical protein
MDFQKHEWSHMGPLDFRELIGYAVFDRDGKRIGNVDAIWEDQNAHPAFMGVRPGIWGMSRMHAIPMPFADIDEVDATVVLPFESSVVKDAPAFDDAFEVTGEDEKGVYEYYRNLGYAVENYVLWQQA